MLVLFDAGIGHAHGCELQKRVELRENAHGEAGRAFADAEP